MDKNFLLLAFFFFMCMAGLAQERLRPQDSLLNVITEKLNRPVAPSTNTSLVEKMNEENRLKVHGKKPRRVSSAFMKQKTKVSAASNEEVSAMTFSAGASSPSSASNSFGQLIVYPSPNASNIEIGASHSVDPYTGKINFSVPLFNLKSRHLEVPISVHYSSAGSRVDEHSSWVGHQWYLSAGGAITRVMKGLPDEFLGVVGPNCVSGCDAFNAFGYLNTKSKVNLSTLETSSNYSQKRKAILFSNFTALKGTEEGGNPEAWDTQPDEFYFNFGKYSGKFVFDQDANIITIPYQNFRIFKTVRNDATTGNIPKIVKFEVTTDDGTIYIFGDDSMSSVEESKLETLTMTNHYAYKAISSAPHPLYGFYEYSRYPTLNEKVFQSQLVLDDFTVPGNSHLNSYSYFSSSWYLKEIRTQNEDDKVVFNYVDAGEISYIQSRSINVTMPTLSEVTYSDGSFGLVSYEAPVPNPGSVDLIFPMKQAFNYSVHEITLKSKRLSSISANNNNSVVFSSNTLRGDLYGDKRLDAVSIYGAGFLVKRFKFEFEEIASPFTQDLFAIGGGSTMNCDAGFVSQKYSILTSNGQTVNLNALVNKYDNVFQAEAKRLYLKGIIEVGTSGAHVSLYKFIYDQTLLPRKFNYQKDRWGYYSANSRGTTIPAISYTGAASGINVSGTVRPLIGWDAINSTNGVFLESFKGATLKADAARSQAGILKKVLLPTGGVKEFSYALNANGATFLWGVRTTEVKEMKSEANQDDFVSTKYTYTDAAEVYPTTIYGWTLPASEYENVRMFSSTQVNPTYMTKGSVVGHRSTEIYQTGLGKTRYFFKDPSMEGNEMSKVYQVTGSSQTLLPNEAYPFPLHMDTDWRRGVLDSYEVLNESGKLLSKTTNTIDTKPTIFTSQFSYALTGTTFPSPNGTLFNGGFYKYQSGWVNHQSTTTETYDQSDPGNESKKISSVTEYSYFPVDPPGSTTIPADVLPRKITQTLPGGDKIITEMKYPLDYPVHSSSTDERTKAVNHMRLYNFNMPIEIITFIERSVNGSIVKTLLEGKLTTYKLNINPLSDPPNLSRPLPWEFKVRKTGNNPASYTWSSTASGSFTWEQAAYKDKAIYTYSTYGKPTLSQVESGINTVYTWSYNNSLLASGTLNSGGFQHQLSFDYQPLVGPTVITDANGLNQNLAYDDFNRLKLERDHANNIETRYRYNYKMDPDNRVSFGFITYASSSTSNTIQLMATGTGAEGSSFIWDFGNGTIKENGLMSELQTYSTPGFYTVKLATSHPEFPTRISSQVIRILPVASAQITSPGSGTARTVCGSHTTTCQVTIADGPYTSYQWEYNYSASGSGNYVPIGTNSSTLNFSLTGVQGSSYSIRCKISDQAGNSRYSNYITIFFHCAGQPGGPSDCPSGWTWNSQLGRCDPPQGYCDEGCFWNGFECACQ